MSKRTVSASTDRVDGVKTVSIPDWPGRQPRVEARHDGKNIITVQLAQQYEGERLQLVHIRGGILQVIHSSTVRGRKPRKLPISRQDLTAVICVPMSMLGTMQVSTAPHQR